jgi:hypothetical protein
MVQSLFMPTVGCCRLWRHILLVPSSSEAGSCLAMKDRRRHGNAFGARALDVFNLKTPASRRCPARGGRKSPGAPADPRISADEVPADAGNRLLAPATPATPHVALQAGGHRFDPGTLHSQKCLFSRDFAADVIAILTTPRGAVRARCCRKRTKAARREGLG